MEMAIQIPFILPQERFLLTSTEDLPHPLVEEGSILLTAWKLSGVISQAIKFRQEWSNCYWREFVPPHRLLTSQPGLLGVVGVLDGVPIPTTMNDVLEFSGNLFGLGKAYNTINVARSMLSGTLPPIEGQPVGQHYLVLKLMKGISKPLSQGTRQPAA